MSLSDALVAITAGTASFVLRVLRSVVEFAVLVAGVCRVEDLLGTYAELPVSSSSMIAPRGGLFVIQYVVVVH